MLTCTLKYVWRPGSTQTRWGGLIGGIVVLSQQLLQFGGPNWGRCDNKTTHNATTPSIRCTELGGGVEVLSLSSQHNNFNVVCELGEGWRLCATVC